MFESWDRVTKVRQGMSLDDLPAASKPLLFADTISSPILSGLAPIALLDHQIQAADIGLIGQSYGYRSVNMCTEDYVSSFEWFQLILTRCLDLEPGPGEPCL